jgi:hypothetical protein
MLMARRISEVVAAVMTLLVPLPISRRVVVTMAPAVVVVLGCPIVLDAAAVSVMAGMAAIIRTATVVRRRVVGPALVVVRAARVGAGVAAAERSGQRAEGQEERGAREPRGSVRLVTEIGHRHTSCD